MISKFKLLENYLNLLLLFLFPTQLALHFWPPTAFVFGIRVDYLAPTIYLTDILFVFLFIPWFIKSRNRVLLDIKKVTPFILLFLSVAIINTIFSISPLISLAKWIKILELITLGYYVNKRKEIFTSNNISRVLFFSLVVFSGIGIIQFIRGETLGRVLYYLGERSFSIFTPGTALVNILGRNFLRAYSTFPHPNALAGYIGASLIFLAFTYPKGNRGLKTAGILMILGALVLSFSLSAFVGAIIVLALYAIFKKHLFNRKIIIFSVILAFLLSFYFAVFSGPILSTNISFPQSVRERLELGNVSGRMFSQNWLIGSGLNTFIVKEVSFAGISGGVWLLQPVHNLYLLVLTETGILGMALFGLLITFLAKKIIESKNVWSMLILVFVLATGLFDHYWFTIQQNLLLLSLFLGLSFREKI